VEAARRGPLGASPPCLGFAPGAGTKQRSPSFRLRASTTPARRETKTSTFGRQRRISGLDVLCHVVRLAHAHALVDFDMKVDMAPTARPTCRSR